MVGRVALSISQSELKVDVGASTTATATVRNRGTVVDQFKLSIEGLEPEWWEVAPSTVSLFPEDEATVTLTIRPPAGALAGTHVFKVNAVSADDPSRSASVDGTLYVAPAGGLLLALDPSRVAGRSGRYTVRIANRANAEARLLLAGVGREEALEYDFEVPALTAPAFGETETLLSVRPRSRPLWGVPVSYTFAVQAVPEGDEEAAAEADGELEYRPLLRPLVLPAGRWRWLLALLPLMALALLIRSLLQPEPARAPTPTAVSAAKPTAVAAIPPSSGGGAQVAPPTIDSFEVVRERPGFALAWRVTAADRVELNGKQVQPEGREPIRETRDQGYELKASNQGGTVVKRINTVIFPPPVVRSFGANPPKVYAGQPTVLRWAIDGAEKARIDEQEARLPEGWLEVRPDATRDYLLWAENPMGWVVHRVSVEVLEGSPPPSGPQVYRYDFKDGTLDWELGTGVWSRVPWAGGYALRGAGHGFVRLTAHSGDVSSLSFEFHLDHPESTFHASLLEGVVGPHTRYFVSFGREGIGIHRQEGSDLKELGRRRLDISARETHEGKVMIGGGSVDVFLDGKPALGVDDVKTPSGSLVSFESLSERAVYVQRVEVQIGPEAQPHPRAPRP